MINKKNIKSVFVLGAGESGVGAALLCQKNGQNVFVSDFGTIKPKYKSELEESDISYEEKKHSLEKLLHSDLLIISPGIRKETQIVKKALENNIKVVSEIEYASWYCPSKIIAITGSNGKTTTTLLTNHIFEKEGFYTIAAGNVGKSFARVLAETDKPYDYVILEVSSFQLDFCFEFKPHIAILTNITPDHLDRYDNNLEKYAKTKFKITQNQTESDYFIYNWDDPITNKTMAEIKIKAKIIPISIKATPVPGAYISENKLCINLLKPLFTMSIKDLALQGKHNQYNSMAAGVASRIEEIRKKSIRDSLMDYKNEAHRMEYVATINHVEYVNDSKATNVNSTWYALESANHPVIWIAGGQDKGNDYSELLELVKDKVKAIICLGEDNTKLHNAFQTVVEKIYDSKSAFEAVQMAYQLANKGDTVLLSPACASFDLFEDYKDRGDQFKTAVKNL